MRCVVLSVKEGEPGMMATYGPQVATIQSFDSYEDAAQCNVGSHPDQRERGRPYHVVVTPEHHWHEFEVFSNRVQGRDFFEAVEITDPEKRTIN